MASTIWSGTKQFTAPSGVESVVAIPVPHRGVIRGYSLVQIDGPADDIQDAQIYTSSQQSEPNASLPEEFFHLFTITDSGEPVSDPDVPTIYQNHSAEYAYINRDGTPSNPQRFLYLRITPGGEVETGPGTKNFAITLTIETSRVK